MDSLTYKIDLDCLRKDSQAIVCAKQGEASGRKIIFTLYEGRTPYAVPDTATVVLRARKPSGAVVYNACEIENGKVIYTVTTQTIAEVGAFPCEIQIIGADGKIIYSPAITINSQATLYSDDEIESENEFTELVQAIIGANNLNIEIEQQDDDTIITITKKDGTQQTVTVHGNSTAWGSIVGDITDQEDLRQVLNGKADAADIPSLDGYATETWVESKGYLTQHQSLAGYATESYVQNYHDDTKQDKLIAGDNITIAADGKTISASGGGGIPDAPVDGKQYARQDGEWSEVQGGGADSETYHGLYDGGSITLTDVPEGVDVYQDFFAGLYFAGKTVILSIEEIDGVWDTSFRLTKVGDSREGRFVLFSHLEEYNDSPDMILATIRITTDNSVVYHAADLSDYALKSDLPENVSDLTNDSGFLTLGTLPIYNGGVE